MGIILVDKSAAYLPTEVFRSRLREAIDGSFEDSGYGLFGDSFTEAKTQDDDEMEDYICSWGGYNG